MAAACRLLSRARALPNGFRYTSQTVTPLGGTRQSGALYAFMNVPPTLCLVVRLSVLFFTYLRSVNGGSPVWVDQPDTGGGHVILSVPVKLTLNSGSNTITFGAGQSSEFFTCTILVDQAMLVLIREWLSFLRLRCGPRQDHRVLIPRP